MDGNRRWAKEKGLAPLFGHAEGAKKLKEIGTHAFKSGVSSVIAYAFSTENWNRTEEEVTYLMELILKFISDEEQYFIDNGIQFRVIGEMQRLPSAVQTSIEQITKNTAEGVAGLLCLAVSYGGRAEIVHAVNTLVAKDLEVITESDVAKVLWTHGLPDPDIIIRTGGEQRLSNFLLWQSAYSELFFTKTKWPDFGIHEFDAILRAYGERERRIGV